MRELNISSILSRRTESSPTTPTNILKPGWAQEGPTIWSCQITPQTAAQVHRRSPHVTPPPNWSSL